MKAMVRKKLGTFDVLSAHDNRTENFGFLGKPLDFSVSNLAESSRSFNDNFSSRSLALLKQVHGNRAVELQDYREGSEGDAIISTYKLIWESKVAIGVRTADCVPIILLGQSKCAVIHAGWRGLAAEIIREVVLQMGDSNARAIVGPCAGVARYQVGDELLAHLPRGVYFLREDGTRYLDLTATARNQLNEAGILEVLTGAPCTITDVNYHSFRRDGSPVGSNLAFIAP